MVDPVPLPKITHKKLIYGASRCTSVQEHQPEESHRPPPCSFWALETVRSHPTILDLWLLVLKKWGGGKVWLALTPSKSLRPPSSLCTLRAPKLSHFLLLLSSLLLLSDQCDTNSKGVWKERKKTAYPSIEPSQVEELREPTGWPTPQNERLLATHFLMWYLCLSLNLVLERNQIIWGKLCRQLILLRNFS